MRRRPGSAAGLSLTELMVALAILSIVLVMSFTTFRVERKRDVDWEKRIDDIYALVGGLEKLRREIEVSRLVVFPPADDRAAAQREFVVTIDPAGRIVVYGMAGNDLVADTLPPPGAAPVPRRVILARVDRIVFHNRSDTYSLRLQVFTGGISLVASFRPANSLDQASLAFTSTYGL